MCENKKPRDFSRGSWSEGDLRNGEESHVRVTEGSDGCCLVQIFVKSDDQESPIFLCIAVSDACVFDLGIGGGELATDDELV